MKLFRFILLLGITTGLVYSLNSPFGKIPPLGKFLDPAGGFWNNAQTEQSSFPSELSFPGIKDEVVVQIDNRLVPHIFANNEHDLSYAQGYVTAIYRLWQLDLQTRAAAGRVAEIVGPAAIEADRYHRRIGMTWAAEKSEQLIRQDETSWELATAYTNGVNDYISTLTYRDLPVEYKLLNYWPEAYSPYRAILLQKYMANMLTGHVKDIEHTNVLKVIGEEMFNSLWPEYPKSQSPIVPGNFLKNEDIKAGTSVSQPGSSANEFISYNDEFLPYENSGSNNWAVAGSKTKDGSPILCNDPHLGLNIPAIWYETQLTLPDNNVYGVTIPGAPGIVLGFNEHVAWGVTNAGRDVKDFFSIEFQDNKRNAYKYAGEWRETSSRIEEIKIAGQESFFDTVIYTHWGPVTYDRNFNKDGSVTNLALKWQAHEPSNDMMAFYHLNRARDYNDYLTALEYYECPGQNFVFISKEGDIAIKQQGKFPARTKTTGRFIQDGSSTDSEWPAFIPNSENPFLLNPERGFVSSANQHPTDSSYPYKYHAGAYFEHYRNRRINDELERMTDITVEDMKRLQTDNFNLTAAEALPIMLQNLRELELSEMEKDWVRTLLDWNRFNDPGLQAPIYFEIWWKTLKPLIWDELDRDDGNFSYPNDFETIRVISDQPNHALIDYGETTERDSINDLLHKSLTAALKIYAKWTEEGKESTWANYKGTRLQHLSQLPAFSFHNIPIGGNRHIVNACSKSAGPSWRMIVKHGEKLDAWGVYPGGQSGNPGSPFYNQMTAKWAAGEYYNLLFLRNVDELDERIIFSQKVHN